jgi:hypothetical protein
MSSKEGNNKPKEKTTQIPKEGIKLKYDISNWRDRADIITEKGEMKLI